VPSRRAACDLLLAVGSTLAVYPIAGVVPLAKRAGARIVILNAEPTEMDDIADAVLRGSISEILPASSQPTDDGDYRVVERFRLARCAAAAPSCRAPSAPSWADARSFACGERPAPALRTFRRAAVARRSVIGPPSCRGRRCLVASTAPAPVCVTARSAGPPPTADRSSVGRADTE